VTSKLLRLKGGRCIPDAPAWAARGLATLSQPLDEVGNGVRGQIAAPFLSVQLGLNLFTS